MATPQDKHRIYLQAHTCQSCGEFSGSLRTIERRDYFQDECPECRNRPQCECKDAAEPDSDGCAACELAEAIRVMNSEPFSQDNQADVAKWAKRVAQREAA